MSITYGKKYGFTFDGDNQGIEGGGSTFHLNNMPSDVYFLPDPPGAMRDIFYDALRYQWFHDDQEWRIVPDCLPSTYPADLWAWNGEWRYDVDPNDPLRENWVLKPDASPVTQPDP